MSSPEYQRQWRERNKDHLKAAKARYYQENKDRMREQSRTWDREHRDEVNARARAYNARNPASRRARNQRHNAAHPERAKASRAKWKAQNKVAVAIESQRRRARRRGLDEHFTRADVRRQIVMQDGRCFWCEADIRAQHSIDHLIPLSRSGDDSAANIVLACDHCNASKGAKLPLDWAPQRWATKGDVVRAPAGRRPPRANARCIAAFGESKPISEWAADPRCPIYARLIETRLAKGWTAERAITQAPRRRG